MFLKIICILFLICGFSTFSEAIAVSEYNETKLLLSINSQLSELRAEQERHVKLIDGLVKDLDIQDRQEKILDNILKAMDVQSIRTELELDIRFLRTDAQFLRGDIQSLKAELEKQRKDGVDKESSIQQLRADLTSLRGDLKLVKEDEANKETNIQQLRAEMEKQRKDGVDKETNIQQLKAELEKQKLDGVDKESSILQLSSHDCHEAKFNGIHDILLPNFSSQPFKVACEAETRTGGWTIILRRIDGSVDFYRNWTEYQKGFGDLNGEFFLGLDKIHALTADRKQELLVILEDFEGDERYETYDEFAIGNEDQQYELHTLGKANGTARDSLANHRGMKFTTFDRDNDDWSEGNCAKYCTGAWWYFYCRHSQLTGKYKDKTNGKGVIWSNFRGHEYSLKKAVMMIRPRK